MATAAELRKHAEKIQRDALQARLDAVQPLIDDLSKRETLTAKLATVQAELNDLDTSITTHYRAALDGGWSTNELASANLNAPKTATRKRAARPADSHTPTTGTPTLLPPDDAVNEQR